MNIDEIHGDNSEQKANYTQYLHVFDEPQTVAQIFDLCQDERIGGSVFIFITIVKIANDVCQCEKSIGKGEHDEANSREK